MVARDGVTASPGPDCYYTKDMLSHRIVLGPVHRPPGRIDTLTYPNQIAGARQGAQHLGRDARRLPPMRRHDQALTESIWKIALSHLLIMANKRREFDFPSLLARSSIFPSLSALLLSV